MNSGGEILYFGVFLMPHTKVAIFPVLRQDITNVRNIILKKRRKHMKPLKIKALSHMGGVLRSLIISMMLVVMMSMSAFADVTITKEWEDGLTGTAASNRAAPTVNLEGTTPYEQLLNLFYPVGCYFETEDISFNPNIAWGGTWKKETIKNDQVVEEGQSGVWTYRKYESGIAECWTSEQRESAAGPNGQEGYIWWRPGPKLNFPSNLFIATPACRVWSGNGNSYLVWSSLRETSKDSISWYWVYDANVSMQPWYTVSAKGFWKTYSAPSTKYSWKRTA